MLNLHSTDPAQLLVAAGEDLDDLSVDDLSVDDPSVDDISVDDISVRRDAMPTTSPIPSEN